MSPFFLYSYSLYYPTLCPSLLSLLTLLIILFSTCSSLLILFFLPVYYLPFPFLSLSFGVPYNRFISLHYSLSSFFFFISQGSRSLTCFIHSPFLASPSFPHSCHSSLLLLTPLFIASRGNLTPRPYE